MNHTSCLYILVSFSSLLELIRLAQLHCVDLIPVIDVKIKVDYSDLADLKATFHQYISVFLDAK